MGATERIYALLVTANPVPDLDALSDAAPEAKPHLRVVEPEEKGTQAQQRKHESSAEVSRRRRLIPSLAMAAVLALIATAAIVVFRDGPSVDSTPFTDSAPVTQAPTTTVAATTTEQQAPATSIAEAGLPTEWRITLSTQETEVEGGVRLDTSIQFENEQLSAEGMASQVVEQVQGTAVECLGTTYDDQFVFLWSAPTQGTGELDFGDSGSVTIEFDAVWVTSSETSGLGTGPGQPRVCAEWSGTYTGASGNLADASGTFTTAFPGASQAGAPGWTFDS